MARRNVSIDKNLAEKLREHAERLHGFTHGAVKREAENAIRKHIAGGAK
jgi:hypothetical protein